MSDFKLLLKRRHLLAQAEKAATVSSNSTVIPALQNDYQPNFTETGRQSVLTDTRSDTVEESTGENDNNDGRDDAKDDVLYDHELEDSKGLKETDCDIGADSYAERTNIIGQDNGELVMGSGLEEESSVLQHHPSNLTNENKKTSNPSKRLEKKDLIFSAGTIRSRYRDVRKEEESRLQKKHNRTMQKHSLALLRESLGNPQAGDDGMSGSTVAVTTKKKVVAGDSGRKNKPTASAARKGKAATSRTGRQANNKNSFRNRVSSEEHIDSAVNFNSHSSVVDDNFNDSSITSLRQPSHAAMSSIISKETAGDSIEELMQKYYEHEDFQDKSPSEDDDDVIMGAASGKEDQGGEEELETVILTESVPLVDYPVNTCIIDGLIYSKFCMDPIYKGDIIVIAKKALQQRQHLLLSSPLRYLSASETPSSSQSPSGVYRVVCQNTISDADRLRECKQILKSIFMSCVAFSSEPLPPPITERTTIQREVTRPTNVHSKNSLSSDEQFLQGKSVSELVELEMLVPPKSL